MIRKYVRYLYIVYLECVCLYLQGSSRLSAESPVTIYCHYFIMSQKDDSGDGGGGVFADLKFAGSAACANSTPLAFIAVCFINYLIFVGNRQIVCFSDTSITLIEGTFVVVVRCCLFVVCLYFSCFFY